MRRLLVVVAMGLSVVASGAEPDRMHMVVADLPYARVWDAALRAVAGYPVERSGDGLIVTGWLARPPGEAESGFIEVLERVTLRVVPVADRITRVTVEVEARGRRDGEWLPLPPSEARARAVLARLRAAQG